MQQDFIVHKWAVWPPLLANTEQDLATTEKIAGKRAENVEAPLESIG